MVMMARRAVGGIAFRRIRIAAVGGVAIVAILIFQLRHLIAGRRLGEIFAWRLNTDPERSRILGMLGEHAAHIPTLGEIHETRRPVEADGLARLVGAGFSLVGVGF